MLPVTSRSKIGYSGTMAPSWSLQQATTGAMRPAPGLDRPTVWPEATS